MKLKDYLKENSITLSAFADKVGSYPQTIHRYASGVSLPKPKLAKKIIAATQGKVALEDIYGVGK